MDIILETIDGKSMGSKLLYKISHKNLNKPVQENDKQSIDFELYEFTVHKRTLKGQPVLEVLIDEANSELITCITELKVQKKEKIARENYEESFKATNCHELRTPLLS